MLQLAGSFQRSFFFPADLQTALSFYSQFKRILPYLPHITLVRAFGSDQFRLLYATTELGLYQVRLYCDLRAAVDPEAYVLSTTPASLDASPVKAEVGLHHLTAAGFYSSESIFHAHGEKTRIDFGLKLWGSLPTPIALRLMPDSVLHSMAANIAQWRMREIAEGFIDRSIQAYLEG
ncbi:MAG: hypothetical protein L0Z70_07350 [Chloroflexi bacterium]|nr:hypothetical protein [Chloroflexota bacterium]